MAERQQLDPQFDDDLSQLEAPKETANKLPVGWLVLFWGLVVWGVWYAWSFTPGLGGWSQAQDLEGGGASMGLNVLATLAFTVIPATAAVLLVAAQRRKGKKQA
ncbi:MULTISPECIES: cbb3-type cytochrome c oxidase N-terminal domain-containing protein [Anaeromyxobacter]|uniref:cbb3-type cytochrome c oxidase N-terminal domain-containing protein n=1 Tax=Anaeromyxobacter TaxID=161492 RepID=UPI001F5798A8|nr:MULTISPECIES: cbb3-type cytochrome c oxidase N-terminal domain-containing protein [unclassified Anaeromyxobacter]